MPPTIHQTLAIDQELLNSVRLIHAGFGQLQRLDGANDFYHLPLQTLASGFERFMKVILCFRKLEETGEFPKLKEILNGANGHDLKNLLLKIQKECFLHDYVTNIQVAKKDLDNLSSDELISFISVLSDFGQATRYYYLDVIVGKDPRSEAPDDEWEKLETKIFLEKPELLQEIKENPASQRHHREISIEVVMRLERFARALARLFTIGRIGKEAKRYLGYISSLLHVRDEELGKKKYCPLGTSV